MRTWLLIGSLAAVAIIGVNAYLGQDAPRPTLAQAVGVLPRTPTDSRSCALFAHDTPIGDIPTGHIRCTWYRQPSAERASERDEVFYHVVSRTLKYAERSWEPATRVRWLQDVDSVRASLRKRGGIRSCAQWTKQAPDEILEYWRFDGFEVMVLAGETAPSPAARVPGRRQSVFLRAEPGRYRQCVGSPDLPA